MGKVIIFIIIVIAIYFVFKVANKLWAKVEVEEKIENNKDAIDLAKTIEKEGKEKEAKKAKEKIDDFVENN